MTSRATINAYYESTYADYRIAWTRRSELACHFGFYDDVARDHRASLARANERLAELGSIEPGCAVMDAGCGLGGTSFWLARHRAAEVLGIALSAKQIARARRAARERGITDGPTFCVADFMQTPVLDASFDVVVAQESLCHTADKGAFFREAWRLLRPGGRLVIADFMRSDAALNAEDLRVMREWLDGWAVPDILSGGDHVLEARGAGFVDVELEDVTANVRRSLRRLYLLSFLGIPVHAVLERIGLRGAVGRGNVWAARRQFQSLATHAWFYGHFRARKP